MTNKTINGLVWNKEVDGEKPKYGFSALAENIYINEERDFTMYDFFAWVKDFFEEGDFSYTGTEEPLGLQTKVWYDTNDFSYIPVENTAISGSSQTFIIPWTAEYPLAVEKGISSTVREIYVQPSPSPGGLTPQVLEPLGSEDYSENENFVYILHKPVYDSCTIIYN